MVYVMIQLLFSRIRNKARRVLLPVWTQAAKFVPYGFRQNQVLDIIRPRLPLRRSWPVAAVFHGGAWRSGSRAEVLHTVCRRYLEKGFLVVNIEYRCDGIVPASEDAVLALSWIATHIGAYGGDPNRMVVTGESAGGHLALLAAFTSGTRVRAVVNFYGVADLETMPGAAKDDSLSPDNIQPTLHRLSPLTYAQQAPCPVISIHGTADPLVSPDQTSRLTHKLLQAGGDAGELILEGGGHGFPEHVSDAVYQRVFGFLKSCGIR
jgi:acetyl esterase/lipase